jgi:hypothetical protein
MEVRAVARPRKEQIEARSERLNLRLTLGERATLEAKAAAAGVPPTDYARRLALDGQLTIVQAKAADPQLVLALNRVGVNLNQIARAINAHTGFPPADLSRTLARLNQLLDDLQARK